MAVTYDTYIGNAGRATNLTGSLNHAANATIFIGVAYAGTTSPSSVTVGGVSAELVPNSKYSQSTNESVEVWYIFRSSAANETVSVTFAATTVFGFDALSFTGANASVENLNGATGSGASAQSALVAISAGTTGRIAVQFTGGKDSANGTGALAFAPGNSETETGEYNYAGASSRMAGGIQGQRHASSTGRNMTCTITKSSRTIQWATVTFGVRDPVSEKSSKSAYFDGGYNRSSKTAYTEGVAPTAKGNKSTFLRGGVDISSVIPGTIALDQICPAAEWGSGSSHSITFPTAPTPGSLVIVGLTEWQSGAAGFSKVEDNQGNTYYQAESHIVNDVSSSIFYAKNVVSSGTFTITATPVTADIDMAMGAVSFTGVDSSSPLSGTPNKNSGTGTTATTGDTTPTRSAVYFGNLSYSLATTTAPVDPWSQAFEVESCAYAPILGEYQITSGTKNASFSITSSANWVAVIAAFNVSNVGKSAYLVGGIVSSKSAYTNGVPEGIFLRDPNPHPSYTVGQVEDFRGDPTPALAYTKGQIEDFRGDPTPKSAYLYGDVFYRDPEPKPAYLKGQVEDFRGDPTPKPAYLIGNIVDYKETPKSAYLKGQIEDFRGAPTPQPAYTRGQTVDFRGNPAPAYTYGSNVGSHAIPAYLGGIGYGQEAKSAYTSGLDTGVSSVYGYLTGEQEAKDNRNSYLSGQAFGVDSRQGYLGGQAEVSSANSAYSSGTAETLAQSPAYINGSSTGSATTKSYTQGGIESHGVSPAFICGGVVITESKTVYIYGDAVATSSVAAFLSSLQSYTDHKSAYASALDYSNASQMGYLCGGIIVSSAKSAYAVGSETATSQKSAYIFPDSYYSSSKVGYLSGRSESVNNKSAYLHGQISTSVTKSAYLYGLSTSVSQKSVYLSSIDYGKHSSFAYVTGRDISKLAQSAYISGGITFSGSRSVYIPVNATTSSSKAAFTSSLIVASYSRSVYLAGISTGNSSKTSYLNGEIVSNDHKSAFVHGCNSLALSKSGYLKGSNNVPGLVHGYLCGVSGQNSNVGGYTRGCLSSSNTKQAYLSGTEPRSHQDAYTRGNAAATASKSTFIQGGEFASSSQPSYLISTATALSNRSIYLRGQNFVQGNQVAYLSGQVSARQSIYTRGLSTLSDSQVAFLIGLEKLLIPDGAISSTGAWKRETGSVVNIWESINESIPDNSNYIYDTNPTSDDYYEFSLCNTVNAPDGDVAVIWKGRDKFNTGVVRAKMELRQGTTVIASSIARLTENSQIYYFTLTAEEKANITDWNDLRIRITVRLFSDFTPADNAATYLVTPTYDLSNQAVHPSVLYEANNWNGYKYWMGMTPYPNGNSSYENPSILASADGETWAVPAGLTNPVVPYPGSPGYNADAEIMLSSDKTTMYLYYRTTNGTNTDKINVKSSTDGVSWGSATTLLTGSKDAFASPAVLYDGSQYVMWLNNLNGSNPNVLERRTCATPNGTFSAPVYCNIYGGPAGKDFWHIDVNKYGNYYQAFMNFCDAGTGGGNTKLYFAQSLDGIDWYVGSSEAIPLGEGSAWDNTMIYRSSGIAITGGYDVFYSAKHDDGTWHIGRTTLLVD